MGYGAGMASGYGAGRGTGYGAGAGGRYGAGSGSGYGAGLASGAAAAFSPSDITGLVGWWKADGTLWQDSGRTTPVTADGDPVGAWDDASGNGNHVIQATAGARPLYKTGVQNSLPGVLFDNTDDNLSKAGWVGTTQWSAFAVAKQGAAALGSVLDGDDGTNRWAQHLRHNGGNLEALAFDSGDAAYTDMQAWTSTSFKVLSAVRGASSVQAWVASTSDGSTATLNTNNTDTTPLTIGSHAAIASQLWNGHILEVLLYNSALSAGNRGLVETYLATKWAV